MKPLVSAIIPTHNRATLLAEALTSVYAQEGKGEEFDLEVIVVDDASSDATPEVVERFPEARYIRFDRNRGPSAARNAGIAASTGTYISFLDDDDLWTPQRLRVLVPVLEADPEPGVAYGQVVERFEGRESVGPHRAPSGRIFRQVLMGFLPPIWSMLIRRQVLETAGGFDETLWTGEDYDMALRLAFHTPFQFLPEPVSIYRLSRKASLWMRILAEDAQVGIDYSLRALEKALALLPDSQEYEDLKLEARARNILWLAGDFGRVGNFTRMYEQLRIALGMFPALIEDRAERSRFINMAHHLASASPSPVGAIQTFCAEMSRYRQRSFKSWLGARALCADIWLTTARQLWSTSSSRWQVGYAAARSLLYSPVPIMRTLGGLFIPAPLKQALRRFVPG
ncbi:MAG: glycosyltransferase [Candidatus Binatia bacterium]|nr:glycosyltransferase [Candidatus Binatia bacterium]